MSGNLEKMGPSDDLTRRQWLLRLGEMVALAGVSGLVPNAATLLAAGQAADGSGLPPGLYDPSERHLMHAIASAGKPFSPPPGSETDYASPVSVPFQPQFFSSEEFLVINRVVEILLGHVGPEASAQAAQWLDLWLHSSAGVREAARTLDPLHRILAVKFYGEEQVREMENADPQASARGGLKAVQEMARAQYARDFPELSEAEQREVIAAAMRANAESSLRKFLDAVRRETIRGYYTSAEGSRELDYRGNAYYSTCPGCEGKS